MTIHGGNHQNEDSTGNPEPKSNRVGERAPRQVAGDGPGLGTGLGQGVGSRPSVKR